MSAQKTIIGEYSYSRVVAWCVCEAKGQGGGVAVEGLSGWASDQQGGGTGHTKWS